MPFHLWPLEIQENYPQATSSEDSEDCLVASRTPQDYSNLASWMCYDSGVRLIYTAIGKFFALLCAFRRKKGPGKYRAML